MAGELFVDIHNGHWRMNQWVACRGCEINLSRKHSHLHLPIQKLIGYEFMYVWALRKLQTKNDSCWGLPEARRLGEYIAKELANMANISRQGLEAGECIAKAGFGEYGKWRISIYHCLRQAWFLFLLVLPGIPCNPLL